MTQALNPRVTLRSLLGNHAGTAALKAGRVSSPLVAFEYADVKVVADAVRILGAAAE